MKILIIGASGFIGKYIYKGLKNAGYKVYRASREEFDFKNLSSNKNVHKSLQEFDIVVNTVGIITENKRGTFDQVHTLSPIVLFDACLEVGVKKVIHISALGSQKGTTLYHRSKDIADEYLRKSGLEYAILHPSIVYGDDGKSTALFQALATLPFTPIIGDGSQILQPIFIEDLVATVKKAIESSDKKIELNLVGKEPVSYKELLETFRKWLGYKASKSVSVPTLGTDVIGKVLGEPTVNHDNIIMLNQGNVADVKPLADFLGYTPIGIKENLSTKEADNAQKLYASLYLIRPLLRIVIGLVWIWSGIVSALLYPQPLALELLHEIGIPDGIDIYLLYVASFLDIALGVLTIIGCCLQGILPLQIVVIIVYTLLLTLLAPYHWLHPFGPILKNIPLVIAIYILEKMERYR
jgi:nucleoside-diphosphate-sugar epimerase/uncharacterized membrane protein YphA (DoxX/SURF4 family)